ncbi:hypothetical protein IL306_003220 [Fusarium sp. DS 682]|nr:hypothetical protein IL306_003220 [Fusarium sp. DS 682]
MAAVKGARNRTRKCSDGDGKGHDPKVHGSFLERGYIRQDNSLENVKPSTAKALQSATNYHNSHVLGYGEDDTANRKKHGGSQKRELSPNDIGDTRIDGLRYDNTQHESYARPEGLQGSSMQSICDGLRHVSGSLGWWRSGCIFRVEEGWG